MHVLEQSLAPVFSLLRGNFVSALSSPGASFSDVSSVASLCILWEIRQFFFQFSSPSLFARANSSKRPLKWWSCPPVQTVFYPLLMVSQRCFCPISWPMEHGVPQQLQCLRQCHCQMTEEKVQKFKRLLASPSARMLRPFSAAQGFFQ